MRGSAHVTETKISGWVFDPDFADRPLEIQLRAGGRVLAETTADLPRPDVNRALGLEGARGFLFAPLALSAEETKGVEIGVRPGAEHPWKPLPLPRGAGAAKKAKPVRRHYQSFGDVKGASRSGDKLKALRLELLRNRHGRDAPLKGLSVLDLGCNEGFFCGEALRQGARRVLGIDQSRQFIGLARERFPKGEFRLGSWWDLPEEKFDVILFLSAIHYEPRQRDLLQKLAGHLTPTGTLIVECGISTREDVGWEAVKRHDGVRRFPTLRMFTQELMKPYAVRLVGRSVPQSGDPVPRHVFHGNRKQTMALLVAGPSKSGKSTLADDLGEYNIPLVHTDLLLRAIRDEARYDWSPVARVAKRFPKGVPNFGQIGAAIAAECPRDFVDILMLEGPIEADLFCIEGEIMRHAAVTDELSRRLREAGIRPWFIAPHREGLSSLALSA